MSTCRGCGSNIKWIRMRSGKAMPVDPEPVFVEDGDSLVFVTDDGDTITGRPVDQKSAENRENLMVGFVPHWATCPEAWRFRR